MILNFPENRHELPNRSVLHIRLDMTFDVPEEIAEQLELWGLDVFEDCQYDPERRQLKMSASTALYRKGA